MKTSFAIVSVAAAVACACAADVNVMGSPATRSADTSVKVATADVLNHPTGLLNKNTLAMDNNVFISRSNILFSQDDRIALKRKVEELVAKNQEADVGVLSKNILNAVSAPDTDKAMMSKASAVVVASRAGDQTSMGRSMNDLVDAVMKHEADEQSIQAQAPRGVIMLTGTTDILRQPSAIVNKNKAFSGNQVTMTGDQIAPTSIDNIAMAGSAKVSDAIASGSSILTHDPTAIRMGFLFQKPREASDSAKSEQWLWGGGLGYGWRYPLGYWNLYGAGLYGGGCGLGLAYGGFYYC